MTTEFKDNLIGFLYHFVLPLGVALLVAYLAFQWGPHTRACPTFEVCSAFIK